MESHNFNEVKNFVDELKKTKKTPPKEIIESLKIIQNELVKIRDFKINNVEDIDTYRRQIKSTLEYNIYKYLQKYPLVHMPEVLSLNESYVEMPKYHFKDSLTQNDIIEILKTLKNFTKMGISHRAINPSHIMFDKNEQVVIIDYGKACYLNFNSAFYSRRPIYASRNALMQEKCHELDDLESLGYVLLDLKLQKKLDTFSAKENFVNDYRKINNNDLRKYFELIKQGNINYEEYINIFKQ